MWMRSDGRKARSMRDAEVITAAGDNSGIGVTPPQARGADGPVHRGVIGWFTHLLGRS